MPMPITQELVTARLRYDPETGEFTWRVNASSNARAGNRTGVVTGGNRGYPYVYLYVSGRYHAAHRIAFLYMAGFIPEVVDHKDGNTLNNRWSNLRAATLGLNAVNSKLYSSNTSGFKGVTFSKSRNKWQAQIKAKGKNIYLGLFDTPVAAHEAYMAEAQKLFGEFARAA